MLSMYSIEAKTSNVSDMLLPDDPVRQLHAPEAARRL